MSSRVCLFLPQSCKMGSATIYFCLFSLLATGVVATGVYQPPVPFWPDKFSIQLNIYVEEYRPDWSSKGVLYYDWTMQTFRADYLDLCLPLFDSGSKGNDNYTCSFLASEGSMYFVNHTSHAWQEYQCCLFEEGLAAVPPDWMKNCQYNGTTTIENTLCDSWWFPGTNDPEKPCYGYWNAKDGMNTPVRFFGLSSEGPTILGYNTFIPGRIPNTVPLSLPNKECQQECKPPLRQSLKSSLGRVRRVFGLPWPTCD